MICSLKSFFSLSARRSASHLFPPLIPNGILARSRSAVSMTICINAQFFVVRRERHMLTWTANTVTPSTSDAMQARGATVTPQVTLHY